MRIVVVGIGLLWLATGGRAQDPNDPLWKRALEIHREAIVVDTHSDLTSRMVDENVDIGKRLADGHQDLPRMAEGGLDVEFFSIYVSASYAKKGGLERALQMIDSVYEAAKKHPDRMEIAYSSGDIARIVKSGRLAACMGLEGGHGLENSFAALRILHRLGVRYVTLTHSNTNDWADSISDMPRWGGLNELGEKMIAEMNRIGVMVDISHVSDETFADVLRVAKAPVIASHSSARALCAMPRNMTDDMLREMKKNGGVVMINFGSGFISRSWGDRSALIMNEIKTKHQGNLQIWKQMWREMDKEQPLARPKLEELIDHIEHVAKVAGVEHVGLGSDFDGVESVPEGIDDVTRLPHITYQLLKRGFTAEDVKKILGGNLLRVLARVEEVAKSAR